MVGTRERIAIEVLLDFSKVWTRFKVCILALVETPTRGFFQPARKGCMEKLKENLVCQGFTEEEEGCLSLVWVF